MKIVDCPERIDGVRVIQDDEEYMVEALENGEAVCRFEWGNSMDPVLKHGEYAILTPIRDTSEVHRGDAVFCRMTDENGNSYYMTHMVWEISRSSHDGRPWFKIGSTMASIYGWTQDVLAIARGTDCIQKVTERYHPAYAER